MLEKIWTAIVDFGIYKTLFILAIVFVLPNIKISEEEDKKLFRFLVTLALSLIAGTLWNINEAIRGNPQAVISSR